MESSLATPTSAAPPPLRDRFDRRIDYLRLSVTDRCDLRCTYCMGEKPTFLPRAGLLDADEIVGIAGALVARGIRRIRLTGGEPLVRRDIDGIAARLGRLLGRGLDELTMTTNASLLDAHALALADAGIRRVNVSLDTLDPARFTAITRRGSIDRTLRGIDVADAAGLSIRINMVAMAGVNDGDLPAMIDWCETRGFDLALIESMPMGRVEPGRAAQHIALADFLVPALRGRPLLPIDHATAGPARYVRLADSALRIGLITPLSHNFCGTCNRIRMSADGLVHGCLGNDAATDLAAAWRSGGAEALGPLLDRVMATKAQRHDFAIGSGLAERGPARHMHRTGG